jgi:hypothetical protein
MADVEVFLISLDMIDDTQRALIHELVKEHSDSWWHQQSNVWLVVGGHKASFWIDQIGPFIRGVPGNVLVVKLSRPGQRAWGTNGLDANWLKENYTNKSRDLAANRSIEG